MSSQVPLQKLPSIDSLMQLESVRRLFDSYSRGLVLEEARNLVDELREAALGGLSAEAFDRRTQQLPERLSERLERRLRPSLRKVVNASGVVLHTNVGRAPISPRVAQAMGDLAGAYSNLEYNLETGRRGHRDLHFEGRVVRLLGCEAATVVNNTAAALFLLLNTLARDRQVLVSRGELIEIGGSFRLPSIMEASGAGLKEVGTTNKTRLSDYEDGIDDDTALILRVHPSNYKVVGFTQKPTLPEMAQLARKRNIPLVEDVGSGYLFSTGHEALSREPSVEEALSQGVDLICFSGDKLLGGPQAGIILGRRDLIARLRKNPLMRALRVDKVTYAALETVLIEYEKGSWTRSLPIYRMLFETGSTIEQRAQAILDRLDPDSYRGRITDGVSLIGGGSAPEEKLPTRLLALRPLQATVNRIEKNLRGLPVPILARIEKDRVLLDLRTAFADDDVLIVDGLNRVGRP